ncbi:MAG TPA: glycosyltransferase family 2 protein [Candidatus Levybacteria bacterium]|nr:glycosyltransferase family 2 protein [Candidatus Levybacteria bacterium]
MNVVIVIPTYNEKENIGNLITILEEDVFPKIKNHKMSILVADDTSPDGTADIVKNLAKQWKNIELSIGEKKGLGAAYIRGMTYAIDHMKADVLFEIDADGQHNPHKIPEFLEKIDEGYDMVVGTRYSAGGGIPRNWGVKRKIYSVMGNLLIRSILMRFYIHDWTGGYRAIKKEVFLTVKNKVKKYKGYTFQVAFLHKVVQEKFTVAEVPFQFEDRTMGKSKIAPVETIADILRYIIKERVIELRYSPFMKYAITGFIGYLINAISLEFFADIIHMHPFFAALFAAELAIIWNFVVNNSWAFANHKIESSSLALFKFIQFNLVSLGSVLINSSIIFIATHIFGNTPIVRQIALIIAVGFFVVPYSYTMYNIFIWKRWKISFLSKLQDLVG